MNGAKVKKAIKWTICILLVGYLIYSIYTISSIGCAIYRCSRHKKGFPHTEDFYYSIGSLTGSSDKYAQIHELTETGKDKEIIVIPRELEGYKVIYLYRNLWLNHTELESDALKKIYIPDARPIEDTFYGCPNLEKVIFYEAGGKELELSSWRKLDTQTTKLYISSYEYDKNLYRGNIYRKYDYDDVISRYFANVSYMYNYENAGHNGYYWIDDYDYGTKIEYIPEEPTREGYTFVGWYREPECIHKWDFTVDTLPEEVTEEDEDGEQIVAYQETRLYAKWTEK